MGIFTLNLFQKLNLVSLGNNFVICETFDSSTAFWRENFLFKVRFKSTYVLIFWKFHWFFSMGASSRLNLEQCWTSIQTFWRIQWIKMSMAHDFSIFNFMKSQFSISPLIFLFWFWQNGTISFAHSRNLCQFWQLKMNENKVWLF